MITFSFLYLILFCLFIHSNHKLAPFDDDYVDVDGEYAQFQLFGVFFIAFLIKTGIYYSIYYLFLKFDF